MVTDAVECRARSSMRALASRMRSHTPRQAAVPLMRLRIRGVDRDDETRETRIAKLANSVGLEQAGIGHEQNLHAEIAGALHNLQEIRMQHRFAARQHEIANRLTVQNVDCFQSAVTVDIAPALARQLIEREAAKAAPGVAGIVERELTKAGAAFLQKQAQRLAAVLLRQRAMAFGNLTRPAIGYFQGSAFSGYGSNSASASPSAILLKLGQLNNANTVAARVRTAGSPWISLDSLAAFCASDNRPCPSRSRTRTRTACSLGRRALCKGR